MKLLKGKPLAVSTGQIFTAKEPMTHQIQGTVPPALPTNHVINTLYSVVRLTTNAGTPVEALEHQYSWVLPANGELEKLTTSRQNCVGYAFSLDYWINIEQVYALLAGEGYTLSANRPTGDYLVLYYDELGGAPKHISKYTHKTGVYSHKQGTRLVESVTAAKHPLELEQYPHFTFYEKKKKK